MTNMHQAAHAQPEHIVISFEFLFFWYSKLMDGPDAPVHMAVLESAEHRWANCDQEVFIAAVIANPFHQQTNHLLDSSGQLWTGDRCPQQHFQLARPGQ